MPFAQILFQGIQIALLYGCLLAAVGKIFAIGSDLAEIRKLLEEMKRDRRLDNLPPGQPPPYQPPSLDILNQRD